MADKERSDAELTGSRLLTQLSNALSNVGPTIFENYPADDPDLLVAEGVRHATRLLSSCSLMFMEGHPAYPYLVKLESIERQYGLPGVDCVYHYASLSGDFDYVLRGNRGSARVFELEVWRGHMSRLKEWTFFSTTTRSLVDNEDFTFTFSRNKKPGDWLELPEGECCILIRQYYYDWQAECPATFHIERAGANYPPPQLSLDEVQLRTNQISTWMKEVTLGARHVVQQYLDIPETRMDIVGLPFGFTKLRYVRGHYRCQANEAVILEVKPPKAKYWNFQLGNVQWEALDYHQRMTAINGHQAVLDSDGVFRAVISHDDPGIANWLDTKGRTLGLISGRYYEPESEPEPTLKKVPLSELDKHLPKDTRKVTPEQRQETIRNRMLSTIRRQCGD